MSAGISKSDRDLPAEIERYVAEIVASAPPLTPEQRDRIAALLRPPTGQCGDAA